MDYDPYYHCDKEDFDKPLRKGEYYCLLQDNALLGRRMENATKEERVAYREKRTVARKSMLKQDAELFCRLYKDPVEALRVAKKLTDATGFPVYATKGAWAL